MINLYKTQAKDFYTLDMREEQKLIVEESDLDRFVKDILLSEQCFTLKDDEQDKILAIGAFQPLSKDRYYTWLLVSKDIGPNAIPLMHCAKRMLKMFSGVTVECHILWNDVYGKKYAELFGFEEAEYIPRMYNGYDFIVYKKRL